MSVPASAFVLRVILRGKSQFNGWQEIGEFAVFGFIVSWVGSYLINLVRVPKIFYQDQELAMDRISKDNAQLKATLEAASVAPKVSAFEQAQRITVREKLRAATSEDLRALDFIVQHGRIDDRLIRERELINNAVRLKNLGLVQDVWAGQHNMDRFWHVNDSFKEAVKHVLYEQRNSSVKL